MFSARKESRWPENPTLSRVSRSGEAPEGLVGVILILVDIDEELGLGLFQRNKTKQGSDYYEGAKSQRLTVCGGGGCILMIGCGSC